MILTDTARITIAAFVNGGTLATGWSVKGDTVIIDTRGYEERMSIAEAIAEGEKYGAINEENTNPDLRHPTSVTA